MPDVRGCHLPDDLLYDVDNNIWYREAGDGNIQVGMTAVAVAMAGQLVAYTPKRVGRTVKPGKSCATIESGKWVGPAKLLMGGEVVAVNETMQGKPDLANDDPYGEGWLVVISIEDWASAKSQLTSGADVAAPYEAKMEADGFAGCVQE
ncbi:MAG: glycine cleavage system protein H [Rhodospirillaceae bacterium]|jgi:glycine cleavage system H protein|nr:glycine cleavage system protein H [Rhodospirillaceae bacterium]MBT3908214.1 glycine cleavage system protein H [Rhodospirillaceae bacterium]MBT5299665.1 glycine cleavage system protein H [Rhodospirillaceae bacterium]MBT6085078.1 glycine cleavage system protein H [Rhodospirillaceae bacterium]MBT6607320.1 glycine cleavage system protein H [Rhodospirillaceae bacterium]